MKSPKRNEQAHKSSFAAFLLIIVVILVSGKAVATDQIDFWGKPQFGGNSFNESPPDYEYFMALRATGATWVRLTFSKWDGAGKDFLIGDADRYSKIPEKDLEELKVVLDSAEKAGIKVVLTPLSLPGARWKQHNNDVYDDRLFTDKTYWEQSVAFWKDLVLELKGHPAIVGYNLLNEPVPEYNAGLDEHAPLEERVAWLQKHQGSSRDLPAFYETVIAAIRSVDLHTPIMVDGGWYGGAMGFMNWPGPLSDKRVLYDFHMYEPWAATSSPNLKRNPPFRYPGHEDWYGGQKVIWDKSMLNRHLDAVFNWAEIKGVPANRLVAGEFGCMRMWQDCAIYLNDVLEILNAHQVHWAFYSFREDVWEGMDYELAPNVPAGQFYYLMEQGKGDQIKRSPHPLLDVIKSHMNP